MTAQGKLGKMGECAAAHFLKKKKYRILDKNVHCGSNELDIVAKTKTNLVFVEVKARCFAEGSEVSRPALAVDEKKRKGTIKAAFLYMEKNPTALAPCFDVVEVYYKLVEKKHQKSKIKLDRIVHIPNAFGLKSRN